MNTDTLSGGLVGTHDMRWDGLRQWLPLGGLMMAAITLLVSLGFCQPLGNAETIQAAQLARAKLKAETESALKVLSDQQVEERRANEKAHEEFRADIKKAVEKNAETAADILRSQLEMTRQLNTILGAPSAPKYSRGKRVDQ